MQVRDITNQLIITPQTKQLPEVTANGKKVTVKFGEDLLPNTTYRLFFGNAISDMHEGNPYPDLEFVFSTGSYIDSLSLSGRIISAFNLKPEKGIVVGLYKDASDSVVYKTKPLYIARTSENGSYKLSNLPKSSFSVFAFSDKNKNLLYDGGEESVGFCDSLIETGSDTIVNIKTFKEEPPKVFVRKAVSPYYGVAYVIYNKEQKNKVSVYYKEQSNGITALNEVNDTCKIYYKDIYDTLRVLVQHSEENVTDTISISILSKEKFERYKTEKKHILNVLLSPVEAGRMDHFSKPYLVFNNWMNEDKMDSTKLILTYKTDSLIKTSLRLTQKGPSVFSIDNKLLPNTNYDLQIAEGALESMIGTQIDSIKMSFKTTDISDYATLNLKLLFPSKENHIVQVVNDKEDVIAEQYVEMSLTSSSEKLLKFKNVVPGNYFLKIIEDKNQNKKWDTGNILRQKQPETIYFNAIPVKLLADWDSETEWKIE